MTPSRATSWRPPHYLLPSPWMRYALLMGALLYLILALSTLEINWLRAYEGLDRGWRFLQGFLRPDFTSRGTDIYQGLSESLTMSITSTLAGILLSIPFGIGAASNISPKPLYLFCRSFIALSRSIQEVIVAIFLVALFGFGTLAGFLTLTFATIGFLAKLLAEEIEGGAKESNRGD
ncbi:PhnE/PtxC family ABC transporter permease [Wolinella succinogenes]|uniref:ABC transmembrane type-1 domain-containing protein n=1 Tax=Wolinella succinogenes (strain ATCC 29543 / DSM 1740 / CCUG 13145 / JCM 31913 / LMG 7466 / NCTC 11488 / FDC 602W) TaxID=273121 RepID=Q7MR98_WOLSU|nr:hypothetical protein [Wolinella succinogenes]CAE10594.1 hypothetical protein WS1551 [Wolinella succinogenes]